MNSSSSLLSLSQSITNNDNNYFCCPCSSSTLSLSLNRLSVKHRGPSAHTTADYSILHTENPVIINENSGIFYCEFFIESFGKVGDLSVGITSELSPVIQPIIKSKYKINNGVIDNNNYSSSSHVQLGLDHSSSFSIQLSNGRLTSQLHNKSVQFLSPFHQNDTIGLGINWNNFYQNTPLSSSSSPSSLSLSSQSNSSSPMIFFTRNGELLTDKELNYEFNFAQYKYFICVCLHSDGEAIKSNFGQSSFLFDLNNYELLNKNNKINFINSFNFNPSLIAPLIRNYLLMNGYGETVKKFDENDLFGKKEKIDLKFSPNINHSLINHYNNNNNNNNKIESTLLQRTKIRSLIKNNLIDEAIKEIEIISSELIKTDQEVEFQLMALKFANILINSNNHNSNNNLNNNNNNNSNDSNKIENAEENNLLSALQLLRSNFSHFCSTQNKLNKLFNSLLNLLTLPNDRIFLSSIFSIKHRQKVADFINNKIIRYLNNSSLSSSSSTSLSLSSSSSISSSSLLLSDLELIFCQLITTQNYLVRSITNSQLNNKNDRKKKIHDLFSDDQMAEEQI